MLGVIVLGLAAAAGVGGGGSYLVSGRTYDFALANSGSVAWRSFELVGPAGTVFVGGTTGNEGSATCVVPTPTEIQCGPLAPSVVPPLGRISFVATMATPVDCGVTFELYVSPADGVPLTRADDVDAGAGCATALTPPVLHAKGKRVRATPPTWSAVPTLVRYSWERCAKTCTPIAGATGLTLRLGMRETVVIVATATFGGARVRTQSARLTVP